MTEEEKQAANMIRTAFRKVRLGGGISLRQARGLDDHADAATLAKYRAMDEKGDWSKISLGDLNHYGDTLSFFDAEGMRFHLPAFLIADLEGTFRHDLLFHLTCFEHEAMSRFALLSKSQRDAVREYLLLRLSRARDERNDLVQPMIEKALAEYWTE